MSEETDEITTADIAAIRSCAGQLRHRSAQAFGIDKGVESDRTRAQDAEAVADKLERRLRA